MKGFQTLQGVLSGKEPEGLEPHFAHYAALNIQGKERLDFAEISSVLGLEPTTVRRHGEEGRRGPPAKHDVWMYQPPLSEERELGEHVEALWKALKPHTEYLLGLKSRAKIKLILGYSSNIDHAGVSIPYQALEMFSVLKLDFALNIVVVGEQSS